MSDEPIDCPVCGDSAGRFENGSPLFSCLNRRHTGAPVLPLDEWNAWALAQQGVPMTRPDLPVLAVKAPYSLVTDEDGSIGIFEAATGDTLDWLWICGEWHRTGFPAACAALGIDLDADGRPTKEAQELILRSLRNAGVEG